MSELESFSLSDRGRRRNNEDFTAVYEPTDPVERAEKGCVYIVADGVGGAARGERASQFAAQKVLYEYYQQPASPDPGDRLKQIMQKVNEDIHSYAELKDIRMATTMVAIVIRNGVLHLANVGDSRAYLIRGDECKQLNRDHSIVGEMVASGEMTEVEAMSSKVKNRLTRSLGGEAKVHVDTYPPLKLSPGDKVLLCTDGLTRYAAREDVYKLTADGSLPEIAQRLVQFANTGGGADNVSVVLVGYERQSGMALAQPISQPADINLDTAPTQPYFHAGSRAPRQPQTRLVALTALVMLILTIAGFNVSMNWNTLKGVVQGSVATNAPTATASAHPQPSPSFQPVLPIVMASNTSAPSITPAPSDTATITGTVNPLLKNALCVRQVQEDTQLGTLSGVIFASGGKYISDQSYYRCVLDAAQASCKKLILLADKGFVAPSWWIVVPGIDRATCESKKGKWVLDGSSR